MKHNTKHYFLSSNSSKGFVSFQSSALSECNKVIKLIGYPPSMMDAILQKAEKIAEDFEYQVEVIHNPLDNSIEGIVVPQKKSSIINTPLYLQNDFHVFNLWKGNKANEIALQLDEARNYLSKALKIHDEWEKIFISNMDFEVLDKLTKGMSLKLFSEYSVSDTGRRKDRYFGAATYQGARDYISNLTQDVNKRYFIKGRPGTGKSTFLKKLANEALSKGFDTEIYHCAFDPDSLDLVLIRGLDVCLFDSTAPHEYYPNRATDEIIDIYDIAVDSETDHRYADDILSISKQYKELIGFATNSLMQAKILYDNMNEQIEKELDTSICQEATEKLITELFSKNI